MYKANPFNMANPFTGEGILASGAKAMINTDYLDELFKTATTQQYDLSISGGSDKSCLLYTSEISILVFQVFYEQSNNEQECCKSILFSVEER